METLEKAVEAIGVKKTCRAGSFLFHARDEARGFFYVRRGGVRVYRMDDSGREVEIVRLGPGEFFGEAVAFSGGAFPANARATDDTEVLFFDREEVFRRIGRDPSLARFFIGLLAGKCLVLNRKIESLGLLSAPQKLARYLLSKCGGAESCLVELGIKKVDLARQLGMAGETLSRSLRELEEKSLIRVRGRHIRILDCPRLRAQLPD